MTLTGPLQADYSDEVYLSVSPASSSGVQRSLEAILGPALKPRQGGGVSVFSSKSGSKSKSNSGSKSRPDGTTTDGEGGEGGEAGGDDSEPCVAMICNPMAEASLATSPKLHTVFEELEVVSPRPAASQPAADPSCCLSAVLAQVSPPPPHQV